MNHVAITEHYQRHVRRYTHDQKYRLRHTCLSVDCRSLQCVQTRALFPLCPRSSHFTWESSIAMLEEVSPPATRHAISINAVLAALRDSSHLLPRSKTAVQNGHFVLAWNLLENIGHGHGHGYGNGG